MKWFLLLLAILFWLVAFAAFGLSATVFGQGIAAAFVVSGTVAFIGFAIVDRLDVALRLLAGSSGQFAHVRAVSADGTASEWAAGPVRPDPYAGG